MAENKTKPEKTSVAAFLNKIADDKKKEDCQKITRMMEKISGFKPVMWGSAIIGFGSYHYKYESGREGDAPLLAFSPRAQNIVLYLSQSFETRSQLLEELGKHKTGKACLYIKTLDDVDLEILKKLIAKSVEYMKRQYRVK